MRAQIAGCTFDSAKRLLLRNGVAVSLTPKAFALLEELVRASPRPLKREEIYDLLWPGTFVEPGNLHNLVSEIRAALGDESRSVLRTLHRFGYVIDTQKSGGESVCFLSYGDRRYPLHDGVNIIGREDEAEVQINAPDVSRRHASLTVQGAEIVLEDLGSKNGTFLGKRRLTGPAAVTDGAEIFLGRCRLTFHIDSSAGTRTVTGIPGS